MSEAKAPEVDPEKSQAPAETTKEAPAETTKEAKPPGRGWRFWLLRPLVEAMLIASVAALLGIGFNALRPRPLDWFAPAPYRLDKDCPEFTGKAGRVSIEEALRLHRQQKALFVDARPAKAYQQQQIKGALSVPYDPLFPIETKKIEKLKKRARYVIVYDALPLSRWRCDPKRTSSSTSNRSAGRSSSPALPSSPRPASPPPRPSPGDAASPSKGKGPSLQAFENPKCELPRSLATFLAEEIITKGFKHTHVLLGGLAAWKKAGGPLQSNTKRSPAPRKEAP